MATLVAALRSAVTYVVIALYVAVAGTIGLAIAVPLKLKGVLYELGHGGVALALGLSGIRYRVSGRQQRAAGARRWCTARITRATSTRRCSTVRSTGVCTSCSRRNCGRCRSWASSWRPAGFIPVTREKKDDGDGRHRPGGGVDPQRQLVPDLPRRHAQPRPRSSCPSRRAASSWRSRRRRRSCRWRCPAAATRCGRGAPSSGR